VVVVVVVVVVVAVVETREAVTNAGEPSTLT
jgi:hypothetical protein